jgi:16S rRNA processing protein RimM
LRILSDSDNIEKRFSKGNKLLYYKGNDLESFTIASSRLHKQFILVTFEGINNINDIE